MFSLIRWNQSTSYLGCLKRDITKVKNGYLWFWFRPILFVRFETDLLSNAKQKQELFTILRFIVLCEIFTKSETYCLTYLRTDPGYFLATSNFIPILRWGWVEGGV